MMISRECVLHYPFPIKLWLCAESDCVDSIYWGQIDKTVYIDVWKLQNYLDRMESIFNVKSIDDFLLHLKAFSFERKDKAECVVQQYYHRHFRANSVVALRKISVDGYTLYSEAKRDEMRSNVELFSWCGMSEDSMLQLWDFGDFEFSFESFEFHVEDIKKLMLQLYNSVIATQALRTPHLNILHPFLYCYHMHNIIFPATWVPDVGVSIPGQTVHYRMMSDDNMLLGADLPDENRNIKLKPNNYISTADLLNTCMMAIDITNEMTPVEISVGESGDHIGSPECMVKFQKDVENLEEVLIDKFQEVSIEPLTIRELTEEELNLDGSSVFTKQFNVVNEAPKNGNATNVSGRKKNTKKSEDTILPQTSLKSTPRTFVAKLNPILENYEPNTITNANIAEPIIKMQAFPQKTSSTKSIIEKNNQLLKLYSHMTPPESNDSFWMPKKDVTENLSIKELYLDYSIEKFQIKSKTFPITESISIESFPGSDISGVEDTLVEKKLPGVKDTCFNNTLCNVSVQAKIDNLGLRRASVPSNIKVPTTPIKSESINEIPVEQNIQLNDEPKEVFLRCDADIDVKQVKEMSRLLPIGKYWSKPRRCNTSTCTCLCNAKLFSTQYE